MPFISCSKLALLLTSCRRNRLAMQSASMAIQHQEDLADVRLSSRSDEEEKAPWKRAKADFAKRGNLQSHNSNR